MTRQARQWLFYCLFAVFIVVSLFTVLYSQGWSFDVSTLTFKKTGGIFVQLEPRHANIFLDEKKTERRRLILSSGILIRNLTPREYDLKLEAEGYRSWNNVLTVEPGLVSEAKEVILIPEIITSETVATSTANWWISDNELIRLTEEGEMLADKGEVLPGNEFLFNRIDEQVITREIEQDVYYLYDRRDEISIDLNTIFENSRRVAIGGRAENIKQVKKISSRTRDLIITTESGVYIFNPETLDIKILSEEVGVVISLPEMALIDKEGEVLLIRSGQEEATELLKSESAVKMAGMAGAGHLFILKENGNLTLIPINGNRNGAPIQIADSVRLVAKGSATGRVFYLQDNNEGGIYNIERGITQKIEIPRGREVKEMSWINFNHLMIYYQEEAFFAGVAGDNEKVENALWYFEEVAKAGNLKAKFDLKSKIFYWLNNEGELKKVDYWERII